jgi:hypothetical protein
VITERARRARVSVVLLGVALASLAAGCGSQAVTGATPSLQVVTVPLATSLVTARGTWAVAVMGGSAAAENNFWQLFVRPAGASRWSLVTPPGVADNGGLVAAGAGTSMLIGFRPSQGLTYSPLAASGNAGQSWTPGLLDADLADVPDALAAGPSGQALALLHDGSIEAAPNATAGQWSPLTTLPALAASAPGRACGLVAVTAVSFGPGETPMAAGSCLQRGVAGVFADAGGAWRAAGPALPAGFGRDQVQVLGLASTVPASKGSGNAALLLAGPVLLAAWSNGTRWTVSGPVAADGVAASGFGPGGSVWALLGNGRAEAIAGAGGSWRALPRLPAGTATLAPGAGGGYDALAVSGSRLTVWQLSGTAWTKVQVINVPIQYGSSS